MIIDTHSHLDVLASESDFDELLQKARQKGVLGGLITSCEPNGFESARLTAEQSGWGYALGIHPMYVAGLSPIALDELEAALEAYRQDPRLVAVGEIGLDFFIEDPDRDRQREFFIAQMRLAQRYALPVSVHARRALHVVMDITGLFPDVKGVIHAFPGSKEQAGQLMKLGWKLGIGGAVTYEGSKRLRAVVSELPLEAIVLETDCPDMAPAHRQSRRSYPHDIADYVTIVAELKGSSRETVIEAVYANTVSVFPRFQTLLPCAPSADPMPSR